MENAITYNIRELVKQLDHEQQYCLRELDRTDDLELKIRVRDRLRSLRSDFHKHMDRLKSQPASVIR